MILGAAWVSSSITLHFLGFEAAPRVFAPLHALLALAIADIGFRYRSTPALCVFLLYFLMEAVDTFSLITHRQDTYTYYLTVNLLFLLQLLINGGASVWNAVYNWHSWRGKLSRHYNLDS
ncbi:MAG: hypothetical protein LUO93_05800 [Methanomicrobiales archaeon]|nr:hypothetical protein [Methanomicrobiales archaeon]